MSEATSTVETPSEVKTETTATAAKASPAPVSPAQDLRDIQYLLLNGIFPGNVAPAVVKAYGLLETMAKKVEEANVAK